MQNAQPHNIKNYSDYCSFLVSHCQAMKRKNPQWTYGRWARQLGLKTTSSITKILQGEREAGPEVSEKLIHYFKFNANEARYFKDLVDLRKIRNNPRLKHLLVERIASECASGQSEIVDEKTFLIISEWFHLPIREFVQVNGFQEDALWISKQLHFKVTPREVKKAITRLLNVGLLARSRSGKLILKEAKIDTTNDIASEAIKRFHEQMLENAKIGLRKTPPEKRECTASTLVFDSSDLNEAKKFIRAFKSNFAKKFENSKGDTVYQVQIQFFPLTKSIQKPSEE